RAGRGHGVGCAARAGARRRARLQHRAHVLHARRQARRCDQGQAERPLCRGVENHRAAAAVRTHHRRRLPARWLRDRQSAAGLFRRYRHAGLDRGCAGAGERRVPRRPLQRGLRAQERRSVGVHRRLCGARGLARALRAPAGLCGGHVPARPLWPHRDRDRRGDGSKMSPHPSAHLLIPTLAVARGRPSRLRRGLRAGLVAASTAIIAVVSAGAYWMSSLGPAPLGEGLAFSALVVDRDGKLLRPYATPEGRWRLPATRANVDPRFLELLLAYEDKRFRAHHGVDPLALGRALPQLITHGRIVSGASTITMQVARLLEPRAARSHKAKLRQMVRAIEIERALSKDEILALYLSLAPYGGNLEGVRAASLAYFGKEPRRLTLGEAAMLVGLPQSPEQRRPDRSVAAARNARDRVLERVAAAGIVPFDEIERA